jgi:hypothetical protein
MIALANPLSSLDTIPMRNESEMGTDMFISPAPPRKQHRSSCGFKTSRAAVT